MGVLRAVNQYGYIRAKEEEEEEEGLRMGLLEVFLFSCVCWKSVDCYSVLYSGLKSLT